MYYRKKIYDLRRKLKNIITVNSITKYLHNNGFIVAYFNGENGDKLLNLYNLTECSEDKDAFTYMIDDKIFVFVNSILGRQEELYSLLHELAHIELGHLENVSHSLIDDISLELEADAFVYELLHPRRKRVFPLSIALISVSVIWFIIGLNIHHLQTSDIAQASISDNVYITRTGTAYHRNTCISIQNKDYAYMTRTEAQKLFRPCSNCNP